MLVFYGINLKKFAVNFLKLQNFRQNTFSTKSFLIILFRPGFHGHFFFDEDYMS